MTTMVPLIRPEAPADHHAIHAVVTAAFRREDEARLVERIRSRRESLLSRVAVIGGEVIGHVLLSPIVIDTQPNGRYAGLAPLSVTPERQSEGTGSLLMRAAIAGARRTNLAALFLLGSPK